VKKKVFITGISGCVGHYLFDILANDPEFELYLLVRNPQKMMRDLASYSNVNVIRDELSNLSKHSRIIADMDCVVHIAAGWGQTEPNYDYTIDLFKLLNPAKCKKVIYFSTASILGPNNELLPEAGKIGTSYIRGKYLCCRELPKLKIYDRIVTLFPTWVLGGDKDHPYSHAMEGVLGARKWLWLIRFFSIDLRFHFIHAADIATIVNYLLRNDADQKKYVLGNALVSADQFTKQLCSYFKKKMYFKLKVKPSLVESVASLFSKGLSDWDKYCLKKKDFDYHVVNTASFGIQSQLETISEILKKESGK